MGGDHGKAFDIKAFARGFGEAFDARGFAEGFRSAFNLKEAGNSFAAGFRDGADLLRKQVRRAVGTLRPREEREQILPGQLFLQRLRERVRRWLLGPHLKSEIEDEGSDRLERPKHTHHAE